MKFVPWGVNENVIQGLFEAINGMKVQLMTVEFRLSGCRSLKEKRARHSGLRDRLGKMPAIALSESGFQDVHDRSMWTLVLLAANSKLIARLQSTVEAALLRVDGELIRQDVELI